jgi:type VI secretion system secreted protein Hcp
MPRSFVIFCAALAALGAGTGGALADETGPAPVHSVDEALQAAPGANVVHGGSITFRGGIAPVLLFNFGTATPRDAASGLPMGKRQHDPITIVREVDSASPSLLQGLNAGIIKITTGADTYTLTGVSVVSSKNFVIQGSVDRRELEQISITFQKIVYSNLPGKTSATDDWASGASPTPTPTPSPSPPPKSAAQPHPTH